MAAGFGAAIRGRRMKESRSGGPPVKARNSAYPAVQISPPGPKTCCQNPSPM